MKSVPRSDAPGSPFCGPRERRARDPAPPRQERDRCGAAVGERGALAKSVVGGPRRRIRCFRVPVSGARRGRDDDPLLALHVAAETDLRNSGILFYLRASSATVAEALEHLAQYAGTTNEANRIEISRHKVETVLTAHPVLAFEEPRRQAAEFRALAVIRALHRDTNHDLAPSRVTFAHARNSDLREIHRLLRCPVEFARRHRQLGIPAKCHGAADHF